LTEEVIMAPDKEMNLDKAFEELSSYDQRCREASESQGLIQIQEALTAKGIKSYIEQTGGFCMVLYVGAQNGIAPLTTDDFFPRVGIANDTVVLYTSYEDEEGSELCSYETDWNDEIGTTQTEEELAKIVAQVKASLNLLTDGEKKRALPRLTLTQQIAAYFGVTEEVGQLVRDYIDDAIGLDWSESTQKEVNEAFDEACSALIAKARR
jgi:DNA-binding XRE family transcriptional regulator